MSRWPTLAQKQTTFDLINHTPYPEQWPFHQSTADVLQLVGAEGAGKSHVAAAEITARVPWCDLIYLVGESYDNPRKEFQYIRDHLLRLGGVRLSNVSTPKTGQWQMRTETGCLIQTLSVREGASAIIATGEQADVFCLCEAGIIDSYSVFTACVRRSTRVDALTMLVGTINDNYGWYAALSDELAAPGNAWRGETFSLPAWTNTGIYPGGRDDPKIKMLEDTLTEDEFARTIAARRVPSPALVFGNDFSYAKNVRPCPYDPTLPVTIWIDPGYFPSAYAVLAVQFVAQFVYHFDEIYLHHHKHQQIIDIAKSRPWWGNVERAVIDFAGRGHHADRSAEEVWAHYAGIAPHSQQVGILEGIARHRAFLTSGVDDQGKRFGRLIHDPGCKWTLGEYKQYRLPTDRDGNPTGDIPVDKNNHAMKAIAYGLIDKFGRSDRSREAHAAVVKKARLREGLETGGFA